MRPLENQISATEGDKGNLGEAWQENQCPPGHVRLEPAQILAPLSRAWGQKFNRRLTTSVRSRGSSAVRFSGLRR